MELFEFTHSAWWLVTMALFAGGNIALGLKALENEESCMTHFIIGGFLVFLILTNPLFWSFLS